MFAMIIKDVRRLFHSPVVMGIAVASVLLCVWFAYASIPRINLILFGLVGLGVLGLLFRFPIVGAAFAAFMITGAIQEFVPSTWSPFLLVLLVLIFAGRILQGHWEFKLVSVAKWAILLFTWHLLTAVWANSNDFFSLSGFYRNILTLLVFTLCIEKPMDYVTILVGASLGIILTGVLSVKSIYELYVSGFASPETAAVFYAGTTRYFGHWRDPNFLAQTLVPFIGLIYVVARTRISAVLRILFWIAFGVGVISVFLSLSRAGILCLLIMLVFIIAADSNRRIVFGIMSIFVVLIILFAPVNVLERLATLSQGTGDASTGQRLQLVNGGLRMFVDSFPFGVGLGNFRTYSADYSHSLQASVIPHNTYIEVLAEMGPVGMILFAGLLGSIAIPLLSVRRRIDPNNMGQNLGIAMQSVFLTMLFSYFFLSLITYAPYWALLALLGTYPYVFSTMRSSTWTH